MVEHAHRPRWGASGTSDPGPRVRRHFFLMFAVVFVVGLAVLGGIKLLAGKGGGAQPAAASASKSGGRTPLVAVAQVSSREFIGRIDAVGVAKARQSVTLT